RGTPAAHQRSRPTPGRWRPAAPPRQAAPQVQGEATLAAVVSSGHRSFRYAGDSHGRTRGPFPLRARPPPGLCGAHVDVGACRGVEQPGRPDRAISAGMARVEARGRDLARDGWPASSMWLMVRLSRATPDRGNDVSASAGLAYLAASDCAGRYCPPRRTGADGEGQGWSNRCRRCAMAAASPREDTPGLPRMLETCTLAVRRGRNSSPARSPLL